MMSTWMLIFLLLGGLFALIVGMVLLIKWPKIAIAIFAVLGLFLMASLILMPTSVSIDRQPVSESISGSDSVRIDKQVSFGVQSQAISGRAWDRGVESSYQTDFYASPEGAVEGLAADIASRLATSNQPIRKIEIATASQNGSAANVDMTKLNVLAKKLEYGLRAKLANLASVQFGPIDESDDSSTRIEISWNVKSDSQGTVQAEVVGNEWERLFSHAYLSRPWIIEFDNYVRKVGAQDLMKVEVDQFETSQSLARKSAILRSAETLVPLVELQLGKASQAIDSEDILVMLRRNLNSTDENTMLSDVFTQKLTRNGQEFWRSVALIDPDPKMLRKIRDDVLQIQQQQTVTSNRHLGAAFGLCLVVLIAFAAADFVTKGYFNRLLTTTTIVIVILIVMLLAFRWYAAQGTFNEPKPPAGHNIVR